MDFTTSQRLYLEIRVTRPCPRMPVDSKFLSNRVSHIKRSLKIEVISSYAWPSYEVRNNS